jgi:hypothetical protein
MSEVPQIIQAEWVIARFKTLTILNLEMILKVSKNKLKGTFLQFNLAFVNLKNLINRFRQKVMVDNYVMISKTAYIKQLERLHKQQT